MTILLSGEGEELSEKRAVNVVEHFYLFKCEFILLILIISKNFALEFEANREQRLIFKINKQFILLFTKILIVIHDFIEYKLRELKNTKGFFN